MKVNIQYGAFRCLNSSVRVYCLLRFESRREASAHALPHVLYPLSMGQLSLYKVIVDGDSLSFGQIAFGDAHVEWMVFLRHWTKLPWVMNNRAARSA